MADQNYKLLIALLIRDQLSGGLKKALGNLRGFGAESKKALREYGQFRSGIAKPLPTANLDRLGSKYRSLTKDAQLFAREQAKIGRRFGKTSDTAGLDNQIRKMREYRRAMREVNRESEGTRASMRAGGRGGRGGRGAGLPFDDYSMPHTRQRRRAGGGILDRADQANDVYQAGRQIGSVWRDRADSLRPYVDETTRLLRAQERLKIIGLSPDENNAAFDAIKRNVAEMKGIKLTDTVEGFTDIYGALGNVNQAISALPLASKYRLGFETLFGDTMSQSEINEQLRSSFKFLELTGNTMKGARQMEEMLDVITKIGASTGGRVSPSEILLMARRGNPAIQSLSTTGLRNISTLIEDMGAEQTGTALMTTYRALVGGVMKEAATAEFGRLGLLDAGKFKVNRKTGLPSKVLPGGNRLAPLFQEDPLKAADLLMERMKVKGIDTTDDRAVQAELQILFQDRNAFRMMNMLTTQRAQIQKESDRAGKSKGVTQIYDQLQDSPLMKLKEYEAAIANYKTTVGLPMLKMEAALSGAFAPFYEFAGRYPEISAGFLGVTKGASGLVETLAYLRMSGISDFFSRTRTGAAGLTTALSRTEQQAIGVKSRFGAIPGLLKTTVVLAGVGLAIEGAMAISNEYDRLNKKIEIGARASREIYDNLVATGQIYNPKVAVGDEQIKGLLTAMNPDDSLADALRRSQDSGFSSSGISEIGRARPFGRWYNPGVPFSPTVAAKQWEQTAKQLHDPKWMAKLIENVRGGGLGIDKSDKRYQPAIKLFEESLLKFDPGAYKTAIESLQGPTLELSDQFKSLLPPVQNLPAAFTNAQNAANSFARNVGSLQINVPSILDTWNNNPQPSGGPTIQFPDYNKPPSTFSERFNGGRRVPKSALGSIINRDGLLYGHRGNVVFPANLSRQRPGDWLHNARALAHNSQMMGARRDKQPAIFPAKHLRQSPGDVFPDAQALTQDSLASVAQASLSAEALRAAASSSSSSSEAHFHNTFNISGNAEHAEVIAKAVIEQMQAQLAEHDEKINDVRHFDKMYSAAWTRGRDRE